MAEKVYKPSLGHFLKKDWSKKDHKKKREFSLPKKFLEQMTQNNTKHLFTVLNNNFQFFVWKKKLFVKETKDFYFNPLNKIQWGPDERSDSEFALIYPSFYGM